MNVKARLERAAENKQWVKVYFHDASGLVGKVVRVGQDYVELESYGYDDSPYSRNFAKNLIPLNFIKMFTVESSNFAEAERKRLEYLSQLDQTTPEVVAEAENKINK
ncbi:MAG: hypothetical protein HY094_07055 [Candidatus Melainabacteria bacterium]|nr:hypothetical protein [Candidatus Melainabacteria bacterium]